MSGPPSLPVGCTRPDCRARAQGRLMNSSGHPDPSQTKDAARVHREARSRSHEARRNVRLHGRLPGVYAVRCGALLNPALQITPHRPAHTGLRSPHQQPTTHFFSLSDPPACLEHRSRSPLNHSSALRPSLSHSHLPCAPARRRSLIKRLILLSGDQRRRPVRARAARPPPAWLVRLAWRGRARLQAVRGRRAVSDRGRGRWR